MSAVIEVPEVHTPNVQKSPARRRARSDEPIEQTIPTGGPDAPALEAPKPAPASIVPVKPPAKSKPEPKVAGPNLERPEAPWERARRERLEAWAKLRDLIAAGEADTLEAAAAAEAAGCPTSQLKAYFRNSWEITELQRIEMESLGIVKQICGKRVLLSIEKVRHDAQREAMARLGRAVAEELLTQKKGGETDDGVIERLQQIGTEAVDAKAKAEAEVGRVTVEQTALGSARTEALTALMRARGRIEELRRGMPEVYQNATPSWIDLT